jgi:hypothetical protein
MTETDSRNIEWNSIKPIHNIYTVVLFGEIHKHMLKALLTVINQPFKDEAQTALFKDPVRTAL